MDTVFRHIDRVILGTGTSISGADIHVRDGRIHAVGQKVDVPKDAEIRNCSGLTAMPGLIDGHCHVECAGLQHGADRDMLPELKAIRASREVEKVVLSGTTTLADAGCRNDVSFALRDAIEIGVSPGPRLLVCGVMIRMTGGRSGGGLGEVDGEDSARRAARIMIAKGVDYLKLGVTGAVSNPGMKQRSPQLTSDEIRAVCEEGHKAGLKIHAHAYGDEGINLALRAGADVIVHGISLNDENLALMRKLSVSLMPTLSTYAAKMDRWDELPDWQAAKTKEVWDEAELNFKRALDAGVEIVAGTDSGMTFNDFGRSGRELDLMLSWGMSIEDAIFTGTIATARAYNRDHELGSIEPGKFADLLLVRGDPLADLGVLAQAGGVAQVWKAGRLMASFDASGSLME